MTLSEKFVEILLDGDDSPEAEKEATTLVESAPDSYERDGLLAMMYHDGIGVGTDLDRSFELAEKSAFKGHQGAGYFLLGYMCDHIETPDQTEGGPRQKYDQYDAERFYEQCSKIDSPWNEAAHLWLGDYYMDMARGGDPEVAIEHYEAIGHDNATAAGRLSDYYWDQFDVYNQPAEAERDSGVEKKVYEWTREACRLNPHDYSFRMGCCYADGIDCDAEKGFRLARKYWEDAYGFGDPRAAAAIASLYEYRLELLREAPDADPDRIRNCEKEIASWKKLAAKSPEPSDEDTFA